MKAASVAYATVDELSPAQRQRAQVGGARETLQTQNPAPAAAPNNTILHGLKC